MSESVKMPALGESVTEGTVTAWLKQVGETIEVDEPLLEVATDKVDTEVPSPFAGVLEEILVEEDETVDVGTALATIGDGSGAKSESRSDGADDSEEAEEIAQAETPGAKPADEAGLSEKPSTDVEEPAKKPEADTEPAPGGGEQVLMPALGESVTEGTVTSWLKAEGDTVEADEPLLEVATDKVDTEVPSPFAGTVQKILVGEDETVDVGTPLAVIGEGAGAAAEKPTQEKPEPTQDEEPQQKEKPEQEEKPEPTQDEAKQDEPNVADSLTSPAPQTEAPSPGPSHSSEPSEKTETSGGSESTTYVTPLVRKLAAEKGVDLESLTGSGVGGRIRKQDVLEAAEKAEQEKAEREKAAAAPAPASGGAPATPSTVEPASDKRGTREKMSRLRQVISKRMVESLQTSAQLTTVLEVDMTRIADLRAKAKNDFLATHGAKLTFLPFFVKAATEALQAHPKLNASIEDKEIVYHGAEHIGIAVDTDRGLLVPVIKDAGDLNLAGIAKRIADLAARTRENKASPDELGGSTFTVTNTGSGGALFDTPIINQPEVAIMGTGGIVRRPAVVKDIDGRETIAIRSLCYLSISYDHRLVDGADASRFLSAVKRRLEEGAFEAELGL